MLCTRVVTPISAALYATARGYAMDQPLLLGSGELDVAATILQLQAKVASLETTTQVQQATIDGLTATVLAQNQSIASQASQVSALQLVTSGAATALGLDQSDGHILAGGVVDKLQVLTSGASNELGLDALSGAIVDGGVFSLLQTSAATSANWTWAAQSSLGLDAKGAITTPGAFKALQTWTNGTSSALGLSSTTGVITTGGVVNQLQVLTSGIASNLGLNSSSGSIIPTGSIGVLQTFDTTVSAWWLATQSTVGLTSTGGLQTGGLLAGIAADDIQTTADLADANVRIALVNQTQTQQLNAARAEFVTRFLQDETNTDALRQLTNGTSTALGLDATDGHILVGGVINRLQVLTAGVSNALGLDATNGSILTGGGINQLQALTAGIATNLGLNLASGVIVSTGVIGVLQSASTAAAAWVTTVQGTIGLDSTGASTSNGTFKVALSAITTLQAFATTTQTTVGLTATGALLASGPLYTLEAQMQSALASIVILNGNVTSLLFVKISTTTGAVNLACTSTGDTSGPVGYNEFEYQNTCGSRYCRANNYTFGLITEVKSGYLSATPYSSPDATILQATCSR